MQVLGVHVGCCMEAVSVSGTACEARAEVFQVLQATASRASGWQWQDFSSRQVIAINAFHFFLCL
jgi:hypothetical protein